MIGCPFGIKVDNVTIFIKASKFGLIVTISILGGYQTLLFFGGGGEGA
jgi:hypothetical protein